MRTRASLEETIEALEQLLEDSNKLVVFVHVGTIMDAVEWLKELKSKINYL